MYAQGKCPNSSTTDMGLVEFIDYLEKPIHEGVREKGNSPRWS
jgi:hypothetical protein